MIPSVLFAASVLGATATASASPLSRHALVFDPVYATMPNVVGEVTATIDEMTFANGDSLALELVAENPDGQWTYGINVPGLQVQLFAVSGSVGPLEEGFEICQGKEISHVAVMSYGAWGASLAFFASDGTPAGREDPGACGEHSYELLDPVHQDAAAFDALETTQRTLGKWTLQVSRDPMEDTETVIAHREADSGIGPFGDPVTLVARCIGGVLDVLVDWRGFPQTGDRDLASVQHRFGDGDVVERDWIHIEDSPHTLLPWGNPVFFEALSSADRLALRADMAVAPEVTATFELGENREAVATVAKVCGYDFPGDNS